MKFYMILKKKIISQYNIEEQKNKINENIKNLDKKKFYHHYII